MALRRVLAVFACVASHVFTAALVLNTQHVHGALRMLSHPAMPRNCLKHCGSDTRLLSVISLNVLTMNTKISAYRNKMS